MLNNNYPPQNQPFISSTDMKVDIAIFSAMTEELTFYKAYFEEKNTPAFLIKIENYNFEIYHYNDKKILLANTGLGTTFAASVLTMINTACHPEYVFLSGTAGGIKSDLNVRDVVIAENAFEAEIQGIFAALKNTPFASCLIHPLSQNEFPSSYSASEELLDLAKRIEIPAACVGTVVSSNTFPSPKELFERIKELNAYAIDMETSAFYQVAWLLNLQVLSVRGISNVLNVDGTDDKVHESDVPGSAAAAANVIMKIVDQLILKLAQNNKTTQSDLIINKIINDFNLEPHIEGGYYQRVYTSSITVTPQNKEAYGVPRHAGTAIYYLLKGCDFSAWHTLNSDELWHFYNGSAIKLYELNQAGELHIHLLGDPFIEDGAKYQVTIPAHSWFAAEVVDKSSYCLVGCTVNPGFDISNYHLADRKALSALFPQHSNLITQFTRENTNYQLGNSPTLHENTHE